MRETAVLGAKRPEPTVAQLLYCTLLSCAVSAHSHYGCLYYSAVYMYLAVRVPPGIWCDNTVCYQTLM